MEQLSCKNCKKSVEIANEDLQFYKKISVPPPTHCPTCRLIRRLAFRNEHHLYKRICDLCKKSIISIYSEDKPFKVYCQDCWWSDKWNATDFGRDFDFSRPFFEQYKELQQAIPRLALMNRNAENSEYCNYAGYNKNCYLAVGGSWYNEECFYGRRFSHSKNSVDCEALTKGELCYETVWSTNTYNCVYCFSCFNSSFCYFSRDLKSCDHCIFSSNLRNKSYYAFNKSVSKEEFEKLISELSSYQNFQKMIEQYSSMDEQSVHPPYHHINCTESTGDYLENCKNVRQSFDVMEGEDCKFVLQAEGIKDVMDVTSIGYDGPQLYYECVNSGNAGYNVKFCFSCWNDSELNYCDTVMNSSDCFGCSNMNRAKYCILNKQYSAQEFKEMREKIIAHMKKTCEYGEFFSLNLSPFDYNETLVGDYFPISGGDLSRKNFERNTYQIPDTIQGTTDEILTQKLECSCGKPYQIIPQELNFYRQLSLPIPRECFDCRYTRRLNLRNPRTLNTRNCGKCEAQIETTYQEKNGMVYCENCYLKNIY